MDRRFNQRFATELPVLLTQLENGVESRGRLEDVSDSGICSFFESPLVPGAIVKLEILGLTLFGHIVYSNPEEDMFRTGIFVEPALLDSSNITELIQSYLTGSARRR